MTKHVTHEPLLNGEGYMVSLINEPVTPEPPRESAAARALRIWFKQNVADPKSGQGR